MKNSQSFVMNTSMIWKHLKSPILNNNVMKRKYQPLKVKKTNAKFVRVSLNSSESENSFWEEEKECSSANLKEPQVFRPGNSFLNNSSEKSSDLELHKTY